MHRGIAVLAVGFVGVLGLAGCTAATEPPERYSVFQRTPTAEDTVPAAVEGGQTKIERKETRYIGEHDDKRLWIARGPSMEGIDVCLVVYPDSAPWFIGCGGPAGVTVSGTDHDEYHLVPDGATPPEDATVISENVYVIG